MTSLRDRVMAHPPEDRLDVALMLLDELAGEDLFCAALMKRFRLSPTEAKIVAAMNARAPAVTSKQVLYAVVYGEQNDTDPKIFDIYVSHIRKKMPGMIKTAWGRGWFLVTRMDLAEIAAQGDLPESVTRLITTARRANVHKSWTEEEDRTLVRMVGNNSSWAAIEDELGRSRRACEFRLGGLVAKNRRAANA